MPETNPVNNRKKPTFLIIVLILVLLIIAVGVTIFQTKLKNTENNSTPATSTVVVTTEIISTSPISIATTSPILTTTTNPTNTPSVQSDKITYFPVNKTTALNAEYYPADLVPVSSAGLLSTSTDHRVRKFVLDDLKDLFTVAKKDGVLLKVTSAYRSYSYQISTFNSWKNIELKKGLSDADAEKEANRYSAKPGHSEHQLGTTLDVISSVDATFDYSASNKKVWEWMSKNLHKYGFVISYPENKEALTGYTYEPWHIRWVGKELANKIYQSNYLDKTNEIIPITYIREFYNTLK